MMNKNIWEVTGKIVVGIAMFVVIILVAGFLWFNLLIPTGEFAWELFNISNSSERMALLQAENVVDKPMTSEPMTSEPMTSEPMTSEPMASEPMASEPMASEPMASEPMASEPMAWKDFPGTSTYSVEYIFKDGSEQQSYYSTDIDLVDHEMLWSLIQKVGLEDIVVTTDDPLLFFYNGYFLPIPPGTTHMGEVWPVADSATKGYDAGFAVRHLSNGCAALASTWTIDEVQYWQAQTAINQEVADWVEINCDPKEVAEWYTFRELLGMSTVDVTNPNRKN